MGNHVYSCCNFPGKKGLGEVGRHRITVSDDLGLACEDNLCVHVLKLSSEQCQQYTKIISNTLRLVI